MDKPLISIIVPVYNGEESVKNCIDSIRNQTYENIEIIIVNDGSTDDTERICKRLCLKDDRIILINQDNKGASDARNTGIDNSKGEYIQFVDSDDYIESNMVQSLIERCIDSEYTMVMCGYFREFISPAGTTVNQVTILNAFIKNKDIFSQYFAELYNSAYINFSWNKLYLSEIIKDNKLRFDNNCSLGEDLVFNLNFIKHSCKILILNKALYHRVEENTLSLSRKFRLERQENNVELYNYLLDYFKDSKDEDSIKEIHKMFLRNNYKNLEYLYIAKTELSEQEKSEFFEEIVKSPETKEAIKNMRNTDLEGLYYRLFLSAKSEAVIKYSVILRHKLKNFIRKKEKI